MKREEIICKYVPVLYTEDGKVSDEAIRKAVDSAYKDTRRTIKKSDTIEIEEGDKLQNHIDFENLIQSFKKYFEDLPLKSQKDFDEWHKNRCFNFINLKKNKVAAELYIGHAQKIINMTFKNLYCSIKLANEDHFQFCHVALDNYILSWCSQKNLGVKRKTGWSRISNYEEYIDIQNKIRKYVVIEEPKDNLTPFQREFEIWDEQVKQANKKNQ